MFDQLIFKRILVEDADHTVRVNGSTIASPFGAFLADPPTTEEPAVSVSTRTKNEASSRLLDDLEASWRSSEPQTFVLAGRGSKDDVMAEREGFEPSVGCSPHTISSRARSAAPAPLQGRSGYRARWHLRQPDRRQICQAPPRRTGTRSPSAYTPVTSTSGEPIMKSMWICERLMRSTSSAPTVNS